MTFSDYNELILQNTEVTDTTCLSCQENATFKYIKIKDVEPEVILVVFECKKCNIKDTSIFNEKSNTNKLIIECNLDNKEDLKREVNLNMHTQLFINYKGIKYEHESSLPTVISVEGIIDQAIEALGNTNNPIIGNREEMDETIKIFREIKNDPVFYMKIEDKDGSSRVGLIDKGVFEMQDCPIEDFNDAKITVLSTFVLIFTLVSKYAKEMFYLPESFVSLLFGIVVGKNFFNIIKVNPYGLFSISRMILCIQTMNVSLSLPVRYVNRNYQSLIVLVLVIGFVKCIFTFIILQVFNSLSLLQCWQLASALTPTDPILCSSIIKGKLQVPNRLRLLLLAESGINDGLGIVLLSIPHNTQFYKFIVNILYKKILLSSSCGIILGVSAKTFFKFCYRKSLVGMDSFIIHTFLLVLVSIGLMEILGGSEFICIFTCGLQFSSDEFISIEYDKNMQETIDLLISTSFFVIFGSTIDLNFNFKEFFTGLIIICIRRPAVCYFLYKMIKNIRNKKEALFIGWFGPIGVGAIYYSMMIDLNFKNGLYYYTSKIVLLSVCVHGMSILIYKTVNKMFNIRRLRFIN